MAVKKLFSSALLTILLCSYTVVRAETYAKSYLVSYPVTAVDVAKTPLQWDSPDWQKAAGFVFIGTSLYFFDEEISALTSRNRNSLTNTLADAANALGEGKYALPAMAAAWTAGYLLHSPKTQDTALLSLKSFLLANGMTTSLKYLTQRQRPYKQNGKEFWNGEGFTRKRDSFPSGHATVVWSIVPILAEQYKDAKVVPPLVYSAAALTCYARVHDQKHWASDVFTGAAIGYFTSQFVLKATPRLAVYPSADLKQINASINF